MDFDLINITASFISEGITQGYKKGIEEIVALNKKNLKKLDFAKKPKKPAFINADFTTPDKLALKHFEAEAFEVAGVGHYELEEKLKALAIESEKNGKGFEWFEPEARAEMLQYIPFEDQAPSGWLETNFNTALNSSYNAAKYNRLQDKDVKDFYPAYKYMTRGDDRVREEHQVLDGQIFMNDDPMLDIVYPPNDWNCRCYMIPLDEDELKAEGFADDRTKDEEKDLTSNVAPDFRRNAAKEDSIFGKWLEGKYKDMPKDKVKEIKQMAKDFVK